MSNKTYTVKRAYLDHPSVALFTGLTLEEAQSHCCNPETSSRTAVSEEAVKHTALYGAWFDMYTEEECDED